MNEKPLFKFSKTSVTLHFIEDVNPTCTPRIKVSNKTETPEANPISSFEKDLLNYQNQKEPPLISQFKKIVENISLIFPEQYNYSSEGHSFNLSSSETEIKVKISVTNTYFTNSTKTIWHLTFAPRKGEFFSEYDLIKLSSIFGSNQENSNFKDLIKFKRDESSNLLDLNNLISSICELPGLNLILLQSGIIQINESSSINLSKDVSDNFYEIFCGTEMNFSDDQSKYFSKTLCGIILGIFDFARMSNDEIFDTIRPFNKDDSSFMIICRGTLLKLSKNSDAMMDVTLDHMIVSPYLVIPSSQLAHNEHILMNKKQSLDNCLNAKMKISLKSLELTQYETSKAMNSDCVYDVFQYQSEQKIIKNGNRERGITSTQNYIKKRLDELSNKIGIERENKSIKSNAMLQSILSLIFVLQLKGIYDGGNLFNFKSISDVLFISLTFIIAIFIYFDVMATKR